MNLSEKISRLDKIADVENKKSGVIMGRVSKHQELRDKLTVKFVKTPSLNVNAALGGGYPLGRTTIITGDSDSGKTFHCLETIALNMRENPDFVAAWLESEHSISIKDLELFGIDTERFYFIPITKEEGGEGALNKVELVIATDAVDMVVINSLKCLTPSEEFKKGIGDLQVGSQARMNAKFMRKITATISETNTALVMIQHLTTQIGGMIFGDPKVLGGGLAIRYGASIITDMRKVSIQPSDPISKEEGIKISVSVKKNHVVTDRFPYVKTEYYGIFGQGTEKYLEALVLAQEAGFMTSGAWINMINPQTGEPYTNSEGKPLKWNGKAKFRDYCIENPEFFEKLQCMIEGKIEYIDGEELEEIKQMENMDMQEGAKLYSEE